MRELKATTIYDAYWKATCNGDNSILVYFKSEADKVIAEKDAEICRLKNGIAPKYSDKTLQERLNEVCEKHGVSTLQDLDWAFCESEKRHTKDNIEAAKEIEHHKYKRCLAMAMMCEERYYYLTSLENYQMTDKEYRQVISDYWDRWHRRWLELAEQFKEAK
jgi:hypothetical protein